MTSGANRRTNPYVTTPKDSVDMGLYVRKPWEGKYAAFNMMLYGEPGEGKTPLLGSVVDVPIMMPALLIDCDSGTLSIKEREALDTMHLPQMAIEREVSAWTCLEQIYGWLLTGEHNYKTIMLDGGTDIQRFCELECIAYGILHKTSDKSHDEELAELADYRRIQERMKRMYMRFRDMRTKSGNKINFIATAHEAKQKEELTGTMVIQPMFMGRGSPLISSLFDIIARMSTGPSAIDQRKAVKRLVTAVEQKARGRSRIKDLGQVIEEPTMAKIAEKIFGTIQDVDTDTGEIKEEVPKEVTKEAVAAA